MNRVYSLVWNRALHSVQVASELAVSNGGGNGVAGTGSPTGRRHPLALACIAALALGAFALPAWSATNCIVNGTTYSDCTLGTAGGAGGDATSSSSGAGGSGAIASGSNANNGGNGGNGGNGVNGSYYGANGSGSGGSGGIGGGVFGAGTGGNGGNGGGNGARSGMGGGGGGGGGLQDGGNGGGGGGGNGGYVGGGYGGSYGGGGGGGGGALGATVSTATDYASSHMIVGGDGGDAGVGAGDASGGGGGGGGAGVLIASGTLRNAGGIAGGRGGNGVEFAGSGGGGGGGVLIAGGGLDNSGTVWGGAGGGGAQTFTIGGAGGAGVAAASGATLVNESAGLIVGGQGGNCQQICNSEPTGAGGIGVWSAGDLTFTNAGQITGGIGGAGIWGLDNGSAGGAGFVVEGTSTVTGINSGGITGGAGGAGGNGAPGTYPGGLGGVGGTGAELNGFSLVNTGDIAGGVGGYGNTGGKGNNGGNGGAGGSGVSGTAFTLVNGGNIAGGNGGAAATGGVAGVGGVGIVSSGSSAITVGGTVRGGVSGDGTTQADAIDLSNGGNTLTLEGGYSLAGNAVSQSGTTNGGDTLALGGSTSPATAFDVSDLVSAVPASPQAGTTYYVGFNQFAKTGTSTWAVTGTTDVANPWDVQGGTLEVTSGSTLGSGTVTVTGSAGMNSTLRVDAGATLANHIVLNSSATSAADCAAGTAACATFDNAGTLSGTANNVTVGSNGGYAVVNNSGAINGNLYAVKLSHGGSVTNAATASITAGDVGVEIDGAVGSVSNAGSIHGAVVGAYLGAGGTIYNAAAGTMSGNSKGAYLAAGGAVANSGAITATHNAVGGALFGIAGVGVNGGAGDISNTNGGVIRGADAGIYLLQGGSVTNDAMSTIEATGTARGDCATAGDCAIFAASTGDGAGMGGALTLSNAGKIIGNVQMDPTAANVTTLTAGGSIAGDLDIGTNAASTLTLDGDTGLQLYSQAVTGATTFAGSLTKSGDGTWIIDSNDLSGVVGTTISAGTLQVGNGGTTGSIGNGDMVDDGALVFARDDTVAFAGAISGSGALTQAGTGTLTLTGANTFTGGTTISAGTLQVGNGGTTGAIGTGAIVDNGTLAFNRSNAVNVGGAISGNGALQQVGSGTLTLDGNSSAFAGSTAVQAGTLIVGSAAGNGAALGGDVAVDSGATLGGHGEIGGNVDVATGAYVAPGDSIGTLTIDGNATFAQGSVLGYEFGSPAAAPDAMTQFGQGDSVTVGGTLSLAGSTLNVSDAGGMGAGLYNVFRYGTLATTGCSKDTAGGSGGCIVLGSTPQGSKLFVQYLSAANQINLIDATGATLNVWNANGHASATQMGGGDGTWSVTSPEWTDATGTVPNSAMTPQPGFAIFGGAPGTVTIDDSVGDVTATGMQFAVDGYTLTGDTLTLAGGNGAAPAIRVGDGTAASAGDTATIDSVIAGSGGLAKTDFGTLVLAGNNTFSGGVALDGGTVSVASDGNLGAASNALAFNGGTLTNTAALTTARTLAFTGDGTLDAAANLTTTGAINGAGDLTKTGAGTLTVNGDGSAFTGATAINGGSLVVGDDSHASASLGGVVTVAQGASLSGIGTLGGLDLSGTLSPGGSIGTLHVTGDVTFQQGSTFNVEAAPDGTADQLAVGGTTTIKGGSVMALTQPGNWAPSTTYAIITSGGGISGTFSGVSDDQAFLTPTLAYGANDVTLTLARNQVTFPDVAVTPNEKGVAGGIEGQGPGNDLYDAVVKLTATGARDAFNQTSGEYHASQQAARIDDSRFIREAMDQRLRSGDSDVEAAKQGDSNVTAWAHAWGHWGTIDGDGTAAKLSDNGDGLLIGADMPIGTQARIGVTGGASRNTLSVRDRASWGKLTSQWLGAFAGYGAGAFGIRGGIAYAWDQVPDNREVNFPGYTGRLSGNATGDTLTGFIEGSWTFRFRDASVSPFLNLAHTKVETDASTEAGGAAALHAYSGSGNVSFSTLGARGEVAFANHLDLHGELGWQHAFGDTTPERSMQFASGGPVFTEYGVPIAKNAGLGRIGIGWQRGNVAVSADYEGLSGGGVKDQAAKLSVNVTF